MAHIIIADDDCIVATILQAALASAGHAVGVLDNGADALRMIRAQQPDIVILDCNMPRMPGVMVVHEMRKSSRTWDIPVVMLTERDSRADRSLALFAGASEYLTKPITPNELLTRVEDMLEVVPLPRPATGLPH